MLKQRFLEKVLLKNEKDLSFLQIDDLKKLGFLRKIMKKVRKELVENCRIPFQLFAFPSLWVQLRQGNAYGKEAYATFACFACSKGKVMKDKGRVASFPCLWQKGRETQQTFLTSQMFSSNILGANAQSLTTVKRRRQRKNKGTTKEK